MEYLLLIVSFAIVLAGALLFTGAVEWIGHQLKIGEGAVGSILAAVGTATPETLIAIVALISAEDGSEDVAIGAIVGAPFLLGTLAMGLVGLFAYLYRDRRAQGVRLDAHAPTLERDLLFFLAFCAIAGALAWGPPRQAAESSARASSTTSSCVFGETFGKTFAMLPSRSIRKVARWTPQYFFP